MYDTEYDMLPPHAFGGGHGWVRGMPMTYEGSKGSSYPPPDPRLVEAQIGGIEKQNQMIDFLIKQSDMFAPLQEEQMREAIRAQQLGMEQSQQDRQWMLGRRGQLTGLQDSLVDTANTFDTEDRREQLAGEAMGDVNQAFSNAREQGLRSMTRAGINPNDGRFSAANAQIASQQALALATAANKTREAARQEGLNLKFNAANMLGGYPAMGMQATGQGAALGLQGLNAANSGVAGMQSGYQAAMGGATNMTNSATNAWSAQADAHLKSQQQDDTLGGLGSLFGGAAKLITAWPSDRRLKTDIHRVGYNSKIGAALYSFRYRHAPARVFIGVMADEVRGRFPKAVTKVNGFDVVNYGMLGIDMIELTPEQALQVSETT